MPRLFDAYIIVDWSASAKPVSGANSIWVGTRARNKDLKFQFHSLNPRTRLDARRVISEIIEDRVALGDKVLVGFDFAMGYPDGTATAIGLNTDHRPPWAAMHDHLSSQTEEREDNSNSRFALAARLNDAMTQMPHPFWGVPRTKVAATLAMTKGDFSTPGSLSEHRISERWIKSQFKANPKSVWQLLGVGSVGSQALLGIATVTYLRARIPGSKLWPFETGFQVLSEKMLADTPCVFAEIYPSTVAVTPNSDEILDEAQVRTLSERLESLDSVGELASAFGPPNSLSSREIHKITAEEGWILAK